MDPEGKLLSRMAWIPQQAASGLVVKINLWMMIRVHASKNDIAAWSIIEMQHQSSSRIKPLPWSAQPVVAYELVRGL